MPEADIREEDGDALPEVEVLQIKCEKEPEEEQGAREATPKGLLKRLWKKVKKFVDKGKKERNLLKRLHFKRTKQRYSTKRPNKVLQQYVPNPGNLRKSKDKGLRRCTSLNSPISIKLIGEPARAITLGLQIPAQSPIPPPTIVMEIKAKEKEPAKEEIKPVVVPAPVPAIGIGSAQAPVVQKLTTELPVKTRTKKDKEPAKPAPAPPPTLPRSPTSISSSSKSPGREPRTIRKPPLPVCKLKLHSKKPSTISVTDQRLQKRLLTLMEPNLCKAQQEVIRLNPEHYSRVGLRDTLHLVRNDFRYEMQRTFQTSPPVSVFEANPSIDDALTLSKVCYDKFDNVFLPSRYACGVFLMLYPCFLQERKDLTAKIGELVGKLQLSDFYQFDFDIKSGRNLPIIREPNSIEDSPCDQIYYGTDTAAPEDIPQLKGPASALCKLVPRRFTRLIKDENDLKNSVAKPVVKRSFSPRNAFVALDGFHDYFGRELTPLQPLVELTYADDESEQPNIEAKCPSAVTKPAEPVNFTKLYSQYFASVLQRLYKVGNSHPADDPDKNSFFDNRFAEKLVSSKLRPGVAYMNYESLRRKLRSVKLDLAISAAPGTDSGDRRPSIVEECPLERGFLQPNSEEDMSAFRTIVNLDMESLDRTPRYILNSQLQTVNVELIDEVQQKIDSFHDFTDTYEYNEELMNLPHQAHAHNKMEPMLNVAKMRPENRAHIVENERITTPYIFEESSKLKFQFSFAAEEPDTQSVGDANSEDENTNTISIPATNRENSNGAEGTDDEESVESKDYFSSYMYKLDAKERMKFFIMKIRGNYKTAVQSCCIEEEDESDENTNMMTGRSHRLDSDEKAHPKGHGPSKFKVNSGGSAGESSDSDSSSSGSGSSSSKSGKSKNSSKGNAPKIVLPVKKQLPIPKIVINSGDGPMPSEPGTPDIKDAEGDRIISSEAEATVLTNTIGSPPKCKPGTLTHYCLNLPAFLGEKRALIDPIRDSSPRPVLDLGGPVPERDPLLPPSHHKLVHLPPRSEFGMIQKIPKLGKVPMPGVPSPMLNLIPVQPIGPTAGKEKPKFGRRGTELNLNNMVRKHLFNDPGLLSPPIKKKNSVLVNNDLGIISEAGESPPRKRRNRLIILTRSNMENPAKILFSAIRRMQINEVEAVLTHYPTIRLDTRGGTGSTLLHLAVQTGMLSIVNCLIRAGADVNVQDSDGNTPSHFARSLGYNEILDTLLAAGAMESIRNNAGFNVWEGVYTSTTKDKEEENKAQGNIK